MSIEKLRIKQAENLKKYAHDIQADLNNIPLENNSKVKTLIPIIESLGKRAKIIRGTFTRTNFGEIFYKVCVENN